MKTVGQLMLADALPEDLKHYAEKPMDKKRTKQLFKELAEKHPDKYNRVLSDIGQMSFRVASDYGRQASPGLDDMEPPKSVQQDMNRMRNQVEKIKQSPDLSPEQKKNKIVDYVSSKEDDIKQKLIDEGAEEGNTFAMGVKHGWKANPDQLTQLLAGDMVTMDAFGQPTSMPGLHGYTEGLSSEEQMAAAPGSMSAMASVQSATRSAGYLGKQISQTVENEKVTGEDCGTERGISGTVDDPENLGRVLQQDINGTPAGTVIDETIAKQHKGKKALMRSPLTCSQRYGLCQSCIGQTEEGKFPALGENIGMTVGTSVSEPLSQAGLCLHPDTEVRMSDWSSKKLKDIQVGDEVIGSDMNGTLSTTTVTDVFNNGVKELYRYKFKVPHLPMELELISTPEHKMLATGRNDKKKYKDPMILEAGETKNYFAAVLPDKYEKKGGIEENQALLIGLLIGDGTFCSARNVGLTCGDSVLLDDISNYLSSLDLELVHMSRYNYRLRVKSNADNNKHGINAERNSCRSKLMEYGLLKQSCNTKELPYNVYEWSKHSIAQLLGGLFTADGTLTSNNNGKTIELCSTSYNLCLETQMLLWRYFGIMSGSKVICRNKGGTSFYSESLGCTINRNHSLYVISIGHSESIRKFVENIPLVGKKRLIAESWTDTFEQTFNSFRAGRTLRGEFYGYHPTMDIEVDNESHLFLLANDLIVSNSSKHSGKVAGAGSEMTPFEEINQLYQVSQNFKGADLSPEQGKVTAIRKAPQGGKYIKINDQQLYASPDKDVLVSEGDDVEQGDRITDGEVNPAEYSKYKSLGEGRRKFAEQQYNVFNKHGLDITPRQAEILAKGFVDHAKITDPEGLGPFPPGKVVTVEELQDEYQPRESSVKRQPDTAKNKYLEEPVLHYSVGTKVTPRIAQDIKKNWGKEITVNDNPPGFEPVVQRASAVTSMNPDWKTRLSGFGIHDAFKDAAQKGSTSPRENQTYVAELMNPLGMRNKLLNKQEGSQK